MALDLRTVSGSHERPLLELPPEEMGNSDAVALALEDQTGGRT